MKTVIKPIEPKLPSKTIIQIKKICNVSFSDNYNTILDTSLYEQLKELQITSINDLKNIYLIPEDDYSYTLEAVLKTELQNENYDSEIEKYNEDLEEYEKQLFLYEENEQARAQKLNKIKELEAELNEMKSDLVTTYF